MYMKHRCTVCLFHIYMYIHIYVYVYIYEGVGFMHISAVPEEASRGHWISWSWSYKLLRAT